MVQVKQVQVIVVGAGAAGIFAAWQAAEMGASVLLIEKTVRVGTKILVSGGGKCNITHGGPLENVLKAFRKEESIFLRPAMYRFTNLQMIDLINELGIETYERPDGRIFPVDKTAKDVVEALRELINHPNITMRYDTAVTGVATENGKVTGIEIGDELIAADAVVLATGGSSFPNSGTTGDGYQWARQLGHTVVPIQSALAPIYLREPLADLSGLALRDIVCKCRVNTKESSRWRGDLLITHHGLSGPCALALSHDAARNLNKNSVTIDVDLLPEKNFEEINAHFIELSRKQPHNRIGNWLQDYAPERVIELMLERSAIPSDLKFGPISKQQRLQLVTQMKQFSFGEVRSVPMEKGEVVAGGVSLSEVDPKTMQSKIVAGLFLCGEILDVAGPVGGYNLQAAWSTGYVAGQNSAGLFEPMG